MAQWQPITNLRSRIIHHPPAAVFFMCLLVLAGAFVSFGIYSQNHDIKNPDINMDWNQMLGSLADLKFCTQLNDTDLFEEKPDMNSPQLLDELIHNTQQKSEVLSVFLLVPLMPVGDYIDHNSISATLLGSQLGIKGSAGKESLNISLFFNVQPRIPATDSALIQNMQIKPQSYNSCLKITTPHHILPQTPSPPECPSTKDLENNLPPIRAHATEANKKSTNAPPCLSLEFIPDPKLTVLLTQVNRMKILGQLSELFNAQLKIYKDEKALARYHLLLVSIVLLALCIMICLFGTLTCSKTRRHLANDPQKDTLLG